jgi:hypothetical protein
LNWQSTVCRHAESAMHAMIASQHCACSQSEHAVQPAQSIASGEIVQLPLLPLLLATAPQMGANGPPPLLPPLLEALPPLSAVPPSSPFEELPLSTPMPLDEPDEPLVLPDAAPLLVPDVLPLDELPPIPESPPLVPLLVPLPPEEPLTRGLWFPASEAKGSTGPCPEQAAVIKDNPATTRTANRFMETPPESKVRRVVGFD